MIVHMRAEHGALSNAEDDSCSCFCFVLAALLSACIPIPSTTRVEFFEQRRCFLIMVLMLLHNYMYVVNA